MAQAGYTPIQLYYSTTAAAVPLAANLAQGELAINIADGKLYYENSSGVVTLLASSTTVTNSFSAGTTGFTPSTATTGAVTLGGTLITSNGGTGLASYTAGDLSYYASGTALTKLAIGTAGQFLTSTGTAPQWSTLSGVAVTTFSAGTTGFTPSSATSGAITLAGTLATTNGGTGLTSFTSGGVVYASSSSALATGSAFIWTGGTAQLGFQNAAANGYAYIGNAGAGTNTDLAFYMGATEGMRLTSTGLGIGTSSPTVKLETSTARSATVVSAIFNETGTGAVNDVNKITIKVMNTASGQTGGVGVGAVLEAVSSNRTGLALYYDAGSGVHVEGVRLDSLGNVGIGTTTPATKLEVVGAATSTQYFHRSIAPGTEAGTETAIVTTGNNSVQRGGMYAENDYANNLATTLIFKSNATTGNATERMRITAAGNVGIGNSSPQARLQVLDQIKVSSADQSAGIVALGDGSSTSVNVGIGRWNGSTNTAGTGGMGYFSQGTVNSGGHYFYTGDAVAGSQTERMRITSGGDLVVNDTATGYSSKLYVNGSIAARNGGVDGTFADAFVAGYTSNYNEKNIIQTSVSSSGVGSGFRFLTSNGGGLSTTKTTLDVLRDQIIFYNDGTEKMRLDSGNLLVGTTSGTQRLVVSKDDSGAYVARFTNTTSSNANGVYIDTPNRAGSSGLYGLTVANSAGNAFAIYTDGTYGTISDINRKKNVETARDGYLTDLCALRVVKYNWKEQEDSEPKNIGFIAQEVEQVFAGMVQTDNNGQKMLIQPVFIPILVKAIQEQQAIIESLKARLDAANL